jgi:prepilin-type N-terminal cleavage/methylation domain-containing protein
MNKISRVDEGFTLIEMLAVLFITGILAAIAVPSLISQKKPMKSAVIQVEGLLKTVNLVARANSGNPYRIRPDIDPVTNRYIFRVEVLRNGVCSNDATATGWTGDINKLVSLPEEIVVKNAANKEFKIMNQAEKDAMTTCFNGRGNRMNGTMTESIIFNFVDARGESRISRAKISVSAVGDVSHETFNVNGASLAGSGSPLS